MDALIRSARLARSRTRLSEARGARLSTRAEVAKPERVSLREEIEQQMRSELAAQAATMLDSERERARLEGREAAVKEANTAAAAALDQLREELTTKVSGALAALELAHQAALMKLESSVGEVAFAALCRLIGRVMTSRAFVMDLVTSTCTQLRAETQATARMHPRDIELLRELLDGQELKLHALSLNVLPDESLELGGCVIEATSGCYDGGLENQLRRLHAALGTARGEKG